MRRIGAVRLLAWLAAAVFFTACGPEAPPRAVYSASAPAANANPRSLGDPNAPVKIIEYGDFQCPFCAGFVRDTKPQIERDYIATGKVYYEFRDLPLYRIHPAALLAANVANCAAAQDRFWPMYARLFQGQDAGEWRQGGLQDFQTFLGYANELHLNSDQLKQCVQSNQFHSQIEQEFNEAVAQGFQGTPSFSINGEPLIGAQPYPVWQMRLDAALATSK